MEAILRIFGFLASWILGFMVLLVLVGSLLPKDDGLTGVFLFPSRDSTAFDPGISRALAANGVDGCADYTYRDAGGGEYHVACWSGAEPAYYVVWPRTDDVMALRER